MKRLFTFISLTVCMLMAQAQVIPTMVEHSTAEDYVILLQKQGFQSYFIPLALCGAYWYDKEGGFFRFCEGSISPSMSEDILKDIEEYYVVGMIVRK